MESENKKGKVSATEDLENELNDIKARLRATEKIAKIGYWEGTPEKDEYYCSENLYQIFGYKIDEIQPNRNLFHKHIYAEDAIIFEKLLDGSLKEKKDFEITFRFYTKQKKLRWGKSIGEISIDKDEKNLYIKGIIQDVTEEIEAKQLVTDNEERYRHLFNLAPVASVILDKKGFILKCNNAYYAMTGEEKEQVEGKHFSNLSQFSLNDIPKYISIFTDILRKRKTSTYNFSWCDKNGKKRSSIAYAAPYYEKGKLKGVHAMVHDFTHEREIEEQMTSNVERYKALANATQEAIFISEKGFCIDTNATACKMFGYAHEEIIGTFGTDVIAEEYKPVVKKNMMSGYEEPYEVLAEKKDGTKFPVMLQGKMFTYGGKKTRLTICRDLSVEKKYQMQLIAARDKAEQNNAKTQSLLKAIPDLMFLFDKHAFIVECHANFEKDLYAKKADIINKQIDAVLPEKVAQLTHEKIQKVLSTKETDIYSYDLKIQGEKRTFESRMTYVDKEKTLAIVRDITDRLKMIKELKKAKEKAEENDKLKSAFLANMSHEIRTPMNGILGFSEMLKKENLSAAKREQFTDIIINGSKQLLHIVNDVLDISKIETGQMNIVEEEIELNNLIIELYTFYKPKMKEKELTFYPVKGLSDGQSKIKTDSVKLRQILNNLISNALKFTTKGHVRFGYEQVDGCLKFSVEDSGQGIPSAMHERIFDRFLQLESGATRKSGGTGLGLAITEKLVNMLGGEIWLESEEGKGTTFYFTLPYKPIQESNTKANHKEVTSKSDFKESVEILLVEDDYVNYMFIEEILAQMNVSVHYASNGYEALALLENNSNFRLVLMDIKMPEMNGFETTKRIKEIYPDMPVIMQTAYAMENDRKKAFDAGCDDYITKPIFKENLQRVLEKFIHNESKN